MKALFAALTPETLASVITDLYWNDGFHVAEKMDLATQAAHALVIQVGTTEAADMLVTREVDLFDFPAPEEATR